MLPLVASKKNNPRCLQDSINKLGQAQQKLSRTKKKSSNRRKQRLVVAKIHDKIARKRNDHHHLRANELLSDNQATTIAFEDLHIKGMIKNHKLARHIADVAWSKFVDIISYKAKWQGKNVIFCKRYAPSSKQCSCGYINNDLILKDRVWKCVRCSSVHDRDILAANNIKKFAIADVLGYSICVKQSLHDDRFGKPVMSKGQDNNILMGHKKPPLQQLAV